MPPGPESKPGTTLGSARPNAGDLVARHNRALDLRRFGRQQEALAEIEAVISLGLKAPETAMARAHLLGDLGRYDEAVAQYQRIIADNPEVVGAHESLAKLLPQIGRGDEAL